MQGSKKIAVTLALTLAGAWLLAWKVGDPPHLLPPPPQVESQSAGPWVQFGCGSSWDCGGTAWPRPWGALHVLDPRVGRCACQTPARLGLAGAQVAPLNTHSLSVRSLHTIALGRAGNTHRYGRHKRAIWLHVRRLRKLVAESGYLQPHMSPIDPRGPEREHLWATFCLLQVYEMSRDFLLRRPLKRMVAALVREQLPRALLPTSPVQEAAWVALTLACAQRAGVLEGTDLQGFARRASAGAGTLERCLGVLAGLPSPSPTLEFELRHATRATDPLLDPERTALLAYAGVRLTKRGVFSERRMARIEAARSSSGCDAGSWEPAPGLTRAETTGFLGLALAVHYEGVRQ
jgi:hypothetical protein